MAKVSLTVQDLFDIRKMAQRYLSQRLFRYKTRAVNAAKRAILTGKRYFYDGGYRKETTTTKRRMEGKSGEKKNDRAASKSPKFRVEEIKE